MNYMFFYIIIFNWVQRLEQFVFFCLNGLCIGIDWWFYCNVGYNLQQVILDYIMYCFGIVVVVVMFFYFYWFGGSNLYVVDIIMVLQWFENVIGKVGY